jgi:hypothetical protein
MPVEPPEEIWVFGFRARVGPVPPRSRFNRLLKAAADLGLVCVFIRYPTADELFAIDEDDADLNGEWPCSS